MTGMIDERLEALEQRNQRVETDKAWETSWTRRIAISVLTYVIVVLMLMLINADRPWLGALVPVCGFVLSTLSLPVARSVWEKRKAN